MPKLAINGGPKLRTKLLPNQRTWGKEEAKAAYRVITEQNLTGYQGNFSEAFYGGPEVRALEQEWRKRFGCKHAICVNSATSGLFVALGAVLGPVAPEMIFNAWCDHEPQGEKLTSKEVIVSPYSMTCSASLPLAWGARPVFADIERDYFCLDPDDVERKITDRTKAILVVSLFGQPYDPRINEIAAKHGIPVIEDAAQALGSCIEDYSARTKHVTTYAGTLGDIGVFSFNQGKHLTCGEGGMIVTDDDELAMKCRLLMNHAEAVVHDSADFAFDHLQNLYGFNLRLTEMQAAILRVQLNKLNMLLQKRQKNVKYLQQEIPKVCPALEPCPVREGATFTAYVLPFRWKEEKADLWVKGEAPVDALRKVIPRNRFIEAVCAELSPCEGKENEGVPIRAGYIEPLQTLPLFGLSRNHCPVCAKVQDEELVLLHRLFGPNANEESLQDVVKAFGKVWENRGEL